MNTYSGPVNTYIFDIETDRVYDGKKQVLNVTVSCFEGEDIAIFEDKIRHIKGKILVFVVPWISLESQKNSFTTQVIEAYDAGQYTCISPPRLEAADEAILAAQEFHASLRHLPQKRE